MSGRPTTRSGVRATPVPTAQAIARSKKRTQPLYGAEVAALRQALGALEELAAALAHAEATTDTIERMCMALQRELRGELGRAEMALWKQNGYPTVPRRD